MRFAGLGANPVGIVDDEADTAYDAYSLIRTGKDQWGTRLPVTSFRGFGDYRLPAYTYLSAPAIAVFGLTPVAVRVPAAVFGSLTILLVYWLVKELFGPSERIPLLSAFLLAISPWHVGMSRIGLEETTSVFFVTAGLLALLKGREKPKWLFIGSVLFAASVYIYTPNIILSPFLFCVSVYFFRSQFRRLKKYILLGVGLFFLVILPILWGMSSSTATTRTKQINITNDSGVIDIVNEKQGACLTVFPRTLCRIVINKYNAFGTKYITNYLNHFSPNLLSINGTNTQYSILPDRGLLYVVDYCLFVVGLIAVFVNPVPGGLLLVVFLLFSAVPDSFTSGGQFGRYFVSYPSWPILSALAIVYIAQKFRRYSGLIFIIIGIFCIAFFNFLVEYWTFFPHRYSQYSHFGYEDLIREIQDHKDAYDRVVVSSRVNDSKQYIYYLFYSVYDPARFQSGIGIEKVAESNGWVRVQRINSIEFPPALPGHDEVVNEHVLLIGAPSEFPKTVPGVIPVMPVPVEFTVKDKAGNILFEGVDSEKLYP